ncbi:MAG: hypothetical protein KatS3mg076_2523 [Candidatus Binatia bacterium]|nr:MAG: hypothetical protein KatS3mg076_2523 [Candidatus Binatia bacterium]
MAARDGKEQVPTREVILDTAEQLFAARGLEGVAVRDLAREMGLTAPSLYNHFRGKQALYDAVLERGLRPILDILAEAWHPGALRPERMGETVDRLTQHLAAHPHLAPLLQRALLEDSRSVRALIRQWIAPLYERGMAVMREMADDAGWEPRELPYLAVGLFGMVFSYFTNVSAVRAFAQSTGGPYGSRSLALQRRFLKKALFRLLGPRAGDGAAARTRPRRPEKHSRRAKQARGGRKHG